MRYGHFDDQNREYVIETPHTPLPWINYLGVDDFHSLISNTLGGYSFYKDAKLRRLTRYRYNNVPEDVSGRFFYIKDEDTVFNAAYLPTKTEFHRSVELDMFFILRVVCQRDFIDFARIVKRNKC